MVRIMIEMPGESSKEWAILELQGDLETRHPVPLSGKFIGDLHFSHQDVPVLIIGHHILHGKVVTLEKPLAVIKKESQTTPDVDDRMDIVQDEEPLTISAQQNSNLKYKVEAVIRKKLIFKTRPKPIIAHVPKKI